VAAAELAQIAISYGHRITLFASGRNARDRLPYVFHLLNALLDGIDGAEILVGGRVT